MQRHIPFSPLNLVTWQLFKFSVFWSHATNKWPQDIDHITTEFQCFRCRIFILFFFGNGGTLSETFQHSSRRKQKNAMEKTFILISDILCLFIVPYCLAQPQKYRKIIFHWYLVRRTDPVSFFFIYADKGFNGWGKCCVLRCVRLHIKIKL